MTRLTAAGAALTTALLTASPALALGAHDPVLSNAGTEFAFEFGKARPPIGYVRFCAANPLECKASRPQPSRLALDPDRWGTLYEVNAYVNGRILPISDQELYGEAERWVLPVDAGDCEDYLLLKKLYLEKLGFPSSALLITVVLDENEEGHAILTIAAEDGDYILDNRRNEILRWYDTKYTFLKRQSRTDPKKWVALVKEKTVATGQFSASNQH